MEINNKTITKGEVLKMLHEKEQRKIDEKESCIAFTESVKMYLELKNPEEKFFIKDYHETIYGIASEIEVDDIKIALYPMDKKEKIVVIQDGVRWSYKNIREASLLIGDLIEINKL